MASGLSVNESLTPGASILSPSGRFRLILQGDGNLVLYCDGDEVLWHTGTNGTQPGQLAMQGDGNLVLYAQDATVLWAYSQVVANATLTPGTVLALQDDGNLVMYAPGNNAVWATYTKDPSTHVFPIVAVSGRGELEFRIKISNTGIVESERYAGFKRQSGTYIFHFWASLLDKRDNTLWAMVDPLTLTIGAALSPLGQPSFVSKRERHVHQQEIAQDALKNARRAAIFLQETQSGQGSLLDQVVEADRIYTKLKNLDLVKDLTKVVALAAL